MEAENLDLSREMITFTAVACLCEVGESFPRVDMANLIAQLETNRKLPESIQ